MTAPTTTEAPEEFRQARDLLLKLREDYDAAREQFEWPRLTHFNFASDWFDAVAGDPETADRDALTQQAYTFAKERFSVRTMQERYEAWYKAAGR